MSAMPGDAEPRPRPRSLTDLFLSFSILALQGFGGVLAIVQRELVEKRRWLTREEFIEDWAVAQIMPGPNVVNLSVMIGDRYFGWRGALAAMAGMLVLPLVVVLALALAYAGFADNARLAGALRGMGAVAAGMIVATGLKLAGALKRHPLGVPACVAIACATFALVALVRWPLLGVLAAVGGVSCAATWRVLKRAPA